MISIVTPVYNEEENVEFFHDSITQVMKRINVDYELIYVNDGSCDQTEQIINRLAQQDSHVRALTFARNFGHQIAITCGMDFAKGDAVITMDGDMQHPPELIPTLIKKWQQGYDIVQTVRKSTEDTGFVKNITSRGYYAFINLISQTPIVPGGSDFRLMDRKALNTFRKFHEHSRFIRGIVGSLGYHQTNIEFDAPRRHAGTSKFSMKKMLRLAMNGVITNSTVPLHIFLYVGIFAAFTGIFLTVYVLYCYLTGITVPGWSTMTILISVFGSINLMGIGVLGEYLGKIYQETLNRPLYWLSHDSETNTDD